MGTEAIPAVVGRSFLYGSLVFGAYQSWKFIEKVEKPSDSNDNNDNENLPW